VHGVRVVPLLFVASFVVRDDLAGVKVIILTTYETDEYVFTALHAGASGFLLKTPTPPTCSPGSASWPPATRCSPPR